MTDCALVEEEGETAFINYHLYSFKKHYRLCLIFYIGFRSESHRTTIWMCFLYVVTSMQFLRNPSKFLGLYFDYGLFS